MQGPGEERMDEAIAEINVIPFIDICLVLLIIVLMTSASQADYRTLELPRIDTAAYRDLNLAITLSVTHAVDKDGKPLLDGQGRRKYQYFFEEDQTPIELSNLWMHLKTVQQDNRWAMLVLRADKETPYEYLALAIQCAQSLGVEDISLAVKSSEEPGAN